MSSWVALIGSLVFAGLAGRSWMRVARYWGDPAAPVSRSAMARYLGPEARRRLTEGAVTNSVCLSGLSILLCGGVWLPPAGDGREGSRLALGLAAGGLVIFIVGFCCQLSIVLIGRPAVLLPRHARGSQVPDGMVHRVRGEGEEREGMEAGSADPVGVESSGDRSTISVYRAEDDHYGQLRRYRVFVDGESVAELRRGEVCQQEVAPGRHTVQVRISWCSSPSVVVQVVPGERTSMICRAVPGVESDPLAVFTRRKNFLQLLFLD